MNVQKPKAGERGRGKPKKGLPGELQAVLHEMIGGLPDPLDLTPLLAYYKINNCIDKWCFLSYYLAAELIHQCSPPRKRRGRKPKWSLKELAELRFDVDAAIRAIKANQKTTRKVSIRQALSKLAKDEPTKYGRVQIHTNENKYYEAKNRGASILAVIFAEAYEPAAVLNEGKTRRSREQSNEIGRKPLGNRRPITKQPPSFGLAELGRRA